MVAWREHINLPNSESIFVSVPHLFAFVPPLQVAAVCSLVASDGASSAVRDMGSCAGLAWFDPSVCRVRRCLLRLDVVWACIDLAWSAPFVDRVACSFRRCVGMLEVRMVCSFGVSAGVLFPAAVVSSTASTALA